MKDRAQSWLKIARWAPSGGNAQNWRAEVEASENRVLIRLSLRDPSADSRTLMDVESIPSIIALAGLGYSLVAAAANDGYGLVARRLTAGEPLANSVAELEFQANSDASGAYSNAEILGRRTHRAPYSKQSISKTNLQALSSIVKLYPTLKISMYSSSTQPAKENLISILRPLERLRWQHEQLLDELLQEISFGREISISHDKIAGDQLGISWVEQQMLRALKVWPVLRVLVKHGFHVVAVHRAISSFVRDSDQVGFIEFKSTNGNSLADYWDFGSCFQHLWLEAHRRKIAMQPLGLPLIALSHWSNEAALNIDPSSARRVADVTNRLQDQFGVDISRLTLGFRLGYLTDQQTLVGARRADEFHPISGRLS